MCQHKLLLVHPSDLYYGSGTAIIYRRLLSLLPDNWSVHHYISTWLSDSKPNLIEKYKNELKIEPHFCGLKATRDRYARISRRWNQQTPDLRIPARLDARNINRLIKTVDPDTIWWSGDYLPLSLYAFSKINSQLLENRKLCFSLYDPPGFWNSGKWSFDALLTSMIQKSDAIDVIGQNMAGLVKDEGFSGNPVILNDYVDRLKNPIEASTNDVFRVAMTGQAYGGQLFQSLLDRLSMLQQFSESEIHWFGTPENLKVAEAARWPNNVNLVRRGIVPRNELPDLINGFHAGYLNMPIETDGFAEFSVPTKLITYLEAGLPVIYHTPEKAEVHSLSETYEFGVNLNLNSDIEVVIDNREKMQNGGINLIQQRYEKSAIQSRLIQHLQIQ